MFGLLLNHQEDQPLFSIHSIRYQGMQHSNVQTKDNGDFDCQVVFTFGVPPVIQDRAKLVVVGKFLN